MFDWEPDSALLQIKDVSWSQKGIFARLYNIALLALNWQYIDITSQPFLVHSLGNYIQVLKC